MNRCWTLQTLTSTFVAIAFQINGKCFNVLLTSIVIYPYNINQQALFSINLLKPELNSICYLLALLGAHHFLHVSRIRVKLLTLR